MKSLLTAVLLIGSCAPCVIAQNTRRAAPAASPATELKKAERQFFDALVARDSAKLNLIVSTDFKEVDPQGKLLDKKYLLAEVASNDFGFDAITSSDFDYRLYGQTAVVTGISTYTRKGTALPELRHTAVWVKRVGKWQLVSWQVVPLRVKGKLMTTESGLQYEDIVEGKGATPTAGQNVSVHYVGTLQNGTKFDSSLDRGQPFVFRIGTGRVIKGWDEGVMSMKVGGKRKLIIPPELGYGARQMGPIPPNSTLVFEVELLAVD